MEKKYIFLGKAFYNQIIIIDNLILQRYKINYEIAYRIVCY